MDGIGHLHAVISYTQRDLLRFIREFDAREAWRSDGCRDMGQWLAGHLGISVSAGRRWTHAAHALEHLPLVSRALEEGTLSLDKVVQLARFVTSDSEAEMISWARRVSVNAIRRKADLSQRPPDLDEVNAADEARFVRWWSCDDVGSIFIEALLPAHEGAVVTKALRRVGEQLAHGSHDPEGGATIEQRHADALFALASNHIASDADADRATVVISADLAALVGGGRLGEVEGGGVIHPETLARICCDSRVQMVTRGEGGLPLSIGDTSRSIPGYMRREMLRRDGGCTFPGCGTRAFVDGHHVVPFPLGPTALHNLTTACHSHHKLAHEGRWRVQLDRFQRAEWYRPDGSRYDPGNSRAGPGTRVR